MAPRVLLPWCSCGEVAVVLDTSMSEAASVIYLIRVTGVRRRQTLECRVPGTVHLLWRGPPILLFLDVFADDAYINLNFFLVVCSPRWSLCGWSGEAVGISSVFSLPDMLVRLGVASFAGLLARPGGVRVLFQTGVYAVLSGME
jgi:hypothetical protein